MGLGDHVVVAQAPEALAGLVDQAVVTTALGATHAAAPADLEPLRRGFVRLHLRHGVPSLSALSQARSVFTLVGGAGAVVEPNESRQPLKLSKSPNQRFTERLRAPARCGPSLMANPRRFVNPYALGLAGTVVQPCKGVIGATTVSSGVGGRGLPARTRGDAPRAVRTIPEAPTGLSQDFLALLRGGHKPNGGNSIAHTAYARWCEALLQPERSEVSAKRQK